jgi:hypothetical protein
VSLWLVLLAACGNREVQIEHDQPGCDDYDFGDPPPESLALTESESALEVQHVGVIASCDAIFEPDIGTHGSVIEVRERWVGDDPDSDCTVCWSPRVSLQDPPRGRYDFRWYIGDEPFDTLSARVD